MESRKVDEDLEDKTGNRSSCSSIIGPAHSKRALKLAREKRIFRARELLQRVANLVREVGNGSFEKGLAETLERGGRGPGLEELRSLRSSLERAEDLAKERLSKRKRTTLSAPCNIFEMLDTSLVQRIESFLEEIVLTKPDDLRRWCDSYTPILLPSHPVRVEWRYPNLFWMEVLAHLARNNPPQLRKVSLENIGVPCAELFELFLQWSKTLVDLKLQIPGSSASFCEHRFQLVQSLSKGLRFSPSLERLSFRSQFLSVEDAFELSFGLEESCLKSLRLTFKCSSNPKAALLLFRSISQISTLESFQLGEDSIASDANEELCFALLTCLQHCWSLKSITLSYNFVGSHLSKVLLRLLEIGHIKEIHLKSIFFSTMGTDFDNADDEIDPSDEARWESIVEALAAHQALNVLDISENRISGKQMTYLFKGLAKSHSIEQVHIGGNALSLDHQPTFRATLEANPWLKAVHFNVSDQMLATTFLEDLSFVGVGASLETIALCGNALTMQSCETLTKGLANSSCLRRLDLRNCNLSDAHGLILCPALLRAPASLSVVDLSENQLTALGKDALSSVLSAAPFRIIL